MLEEDRDTHVSLATHFSDARMSLAEKMQVGIRLIQNLRDLHKILDGNFPTPYLSEYHFQKWEVKWLFTDTPE